MRPSQQAEAEKVLGVRAFSEHEYLPLVVLIGSFLNTI